MSHGRLSNKNNDEKLDALPLRSGKRFIYPLSPLYHTGSPWQCNKTRKWNTRYKDLEGRNKTVFVCKCHDCLCRKFQKKKCQKTNKPTNNNDKNLMEVNDYSKVSGYKSQLLFYTSVMNIWNLKLKTPFTWTENNKILRFKSNKTCIRSIWVKLENSDERNQSLINGGIFYVYG